MGLAFAASLGSLQGIYFELLLALSFQLRMGRKIAVAGLPLLRRLRITAAIPAGDQFEHTVAAAAFVHDLITGAPIIPTASLRHEGAIHSGFYCCTYHSDYLQESC